MSDDLKQPNPNVGVPSMVSGGTAWPRADSSYPDPSEADLSSPLFEAVWQAIRTWDISRYSNGLYAGPTGNDAMRIIGFIRPIIDAQSAEIQRLKADSAEWEQLARSAQRERDTLAAEIQRLNSQHAMDVMSITSKHAAEMSTLVAEIKRMRGTLDLPCSMGVGDGSGQLFVHGDYESIKAAQAIVFERDALAAELVKTRDTMRAALKVSWQPIDTCPIDKAVLLWRMPINYDNPYAECCTIGQIPSHKRGVWWDVNECSYKSMKHLTHWMPLPSTPRAALQSEEKR